MKMKSLLQVDIADLKVDRRGSSDSTKLDHHEIVCPTIGAINVYLQVSLSHTHTHTHTCRLVDGTSMNEECD